jgi:hypothetical protein
VSVPQAFPPLGPEFEPFLYAVVCNEGNGMPLTINSVIARSGADPWKEAARIAKLPRDVALEVLARMIPERSRASDAVSGAEDVAISGAEDVPISGAEDVAIANRLFALLPIAREKRIVPVAAAIEVAPRWSPVVPIILVLLVCLALVSAFRMSTHSDAERRQTPSAPAADKVDP